MTERVLSARELNRALLARQLLLGRSALPLPRALQHVAGLQSQYAPSTYVGLWSRLQGFRRDSLTKALERRRAVQATLMRVTIHLVSANDFWLFAAGTRKARREWWLRVQQHQLEGVDMEAAAAVIRRHLAEGPRRGAELITILRAEGFPKVAWSGVGMWLDLVRVPPSGTWEQRRADLYGLADRWLGSSSASEAEGQEHLVRRYLGGFGPASLSDIANWAGLPISGIRSTVERVRLRRFRDENGQELLDVPRAPLPEPSVPAPIRFLPNWDATLLAHARRTGVLPEAYRGRIFGTRTPHSESTFLVDGVVAGTWRYAGGKVQLDPFEPLPRVARRDLEDEAQRLAALHAG